MRQLIIARKDLNMSPGKLAAQVSHASMAFLTNEIRKKAFPVYDADVHLSFEYDLNGKKVPKLYRRTDLTQWAKDAFNKGEDVFYTRFVSNIDLELCKPEITKYIAELNLSPELYENWINGAFVKTVCQAKNRTQLLKAITLAEELGLEEFRDFFLIKDNCLTELEPEEFDEGGQGRTLTCIGFRPLPDEIAHAISKKYHLYA